MKRQKILWLAVLCCLLLVAAVVILVTAQSRPPAEPVRPETALPTASAPNPTPEATASGVSDAAATATPAIVPTATPKPTETPKVTPSPTAAPTPAPTPTPEPEKETVTLSIVCDRALESDLLPEPVRAVLPADGVILAVVTTELKAGETVWDVLQRVCRDSGVALEASWTPAYHTAYVQGIGQLYEFDCGQGSGWVYSVNGVVPGVGCSGYALKNGDAVRWMYTCDYGNDVGG